MKHTALNPGWYLWMVAVMVIALSCQRQPQEIPTQQPVPTVGGSVESKAIDPATYENPFGETEPPAAENPAAVALDDKGIATSPSASSTPTGPVSQSSGSNTAMLQSALSSLPALMQCMSQQCDPGAVFGMLSGTFLNTMANSGENGAMIAQTMAPLMGMFSGGGQ